MSGQESTTPDAPTDETTEDVKLTRSRVRMYLMVELEQVGPVGVSDSALESALRHLVKGKGSTGRIVWAVGAGTAETAYRVIDVTGARVPGRRRGTNAAAA